MTAGSTDAGREAGRALRSAVPRSSRGEWSPAADRPDPVELITSQDERSLT